MIPYYTKRAYLGVGSFNHLEKYEFVNGKDDIPSILEKKITNVPNHQYPPISMHFAMVELQ